jgi:hypothetical protein
MNGPEFMQVKITGTPEFIKEVEEEAHAAPNEITIVSSEPDEDSSVLEFGLVEASAILAVVKGAAWVGTMSVKLYEWLKEKDRKIVVETPLGRCEFVAREDLSEEEIRKVLNTLAGI